MKFTMKLLALFFGVMMLGNVAHAESPREQLKQMVGQLQKTPTDNALREKIIRLAQELKPAPAVPDAAVEFEGRAQFAFKNAKSNDDYLAAAREYEKAVTDAPWVSGYYADLCTIYEKAGKLAEAKRNCEFSLVGIADSAQITDIKRRIAGLKYGIEQNSPSAVAEREKKKDDEFLKKLDGARFFLRVHRDTKDNNGRVGWTEFAGVYEIRGNKIFHGDVITARSEPNNYGSPVGDIRWEKDSYYLIAGREFVIPKDDRECQDSKRRCFDEIQTVSADGNKITEHRTSWGKLYEEIYLRDK